MDTWEVVSDRVASEISRVSDILNERATSEVERVFQTHSNSSPATSTDQSRAIQEDIQKLDSKVEVSLRAFSREVEELWKWMAQSIEGQSAQAGREKEVIRGRFSEAKAQMKGLRSNALAVGSFIHAKFPSRRGGASGPTDSPKQGQSSPRIIDGPTSFCKTNAGI